jgi:hypothetical protein
VSTPALIYLVIAAIGLGIAVEQHGKPRKGVHSFWGHLTALSIALGLLYWGGFFGSAK